MAITWPAKNNYATGDVLTATNMNGIGDDLNDLFNNNFYAGKNKIINGDMGIWQRGTSFAASASTSPFTADRWQTSIGTGAAATISQQAFTAGAAPVAGYESAYFLRFARTTTGSTPCYLYQKIEDVRTLAGQTATVSFWAKAASTYTFAAGEIYLEQSWGTGGTAGSVVTNVNTGSQVVTTSWTRYSFSVAVPATTGKTIGTSSSLALVFNFATGQGTSTFDIWGVQVEAGSTATPFQTATGTKQGELAACQRYYWRVTADNNQNLAATAFAGSTTLANCQFQFPVPMRTTPTALDSNSVKFVNYAGSAFTMSSLAFNQATPFFAQIYGTISGATAGHAGAILGSASGAYLGLTAEL